jgi:hypothetical protein
VVLGVLSRVLQEIEPLPGGCVTEEGNWIVSVGSLRRDHALNIANCAPLKYKGSAVTFKR